MARYYRKRRFYRKKNKWDIEQRASTTYQNAWQSISGIGYFNRQVLVPIVPAITQEGVRKVKNLSISMAISSPGGNGTNNPDEQVRTYGPIYWALVYAPEGTPVNDLQMDGELYQPSNFVINSGIIDNTNTNKYRISSRLARNLRANDRIYLILGTNLNTSAEYAATPSINWLVRYAVCFN